MEKNHTQSSGIGTVVTGVETAATYAEFSADPRAGRAIVGVPAELAARIPGFADMGVDPDTVVEAIRQAGPERGPATPGWADAMIAYGDTQFRKGETAEAGPTPNDSERHFLEASFWYFFARFPHILNPAGARAYGQHREAYRRALKRSEFPGAFIDIPFDDKVIPAILRLPTTGAGPFPTVMIWGGIDVWKSDLEIHYQSEAFLRLGLATLAIDMPGTGESPIHASTTAEAAYRAAITFLRGDRRVDGRRIGAYGLSFGGHFATKLALIEPSLAGVVAVGGPIHLAFQAENLAKLPFGTKIALARIMGIDATNDVAVLARAFASLSLHTQGLLPARGNAPLLSMNGDADDLVPIADLHYLGQQGVRQDTLVFSGDRHCANRNWRLHTPFTAAWLADKLSR